MEPIVDPETFTAADLLIVAEAIADHVNGAAQPITDQDLAACGEDISRHSRESRLIERVAWCDRAHASIQRYAESAFTDRPFTEWCGDFGRALDLQSIALDSIIHWTQVEYYR